MNIFLQAAANGIMVGGIYALIGMSLTLIFGVMKIINFCQGELLMLGMYISFVLFDQCGLDPFVAPYLPIMKRCNFSLILFICKQSFPHYPACCQVYFSGSRGSFIRE